MTIETVQPHSDSAKRVLVVFCHPCAESFNAAIRDRVMATLRAGGHDVQLIDLYAEGFQPIMDAEERRGYHDRGDNTKPVEAQLRLIKWATALVFVYPTWWYGLPAMLKGWLDRVWVPHEAFVMPTDEHGILPNLRHVHEIACITTCGATWGISKLIGEPGRKTILRGIRALCHPTCRTLYMALYQMDTVSAERRAAYLQRIDRRLAMFMSGKRRFAGLFRDLRGQKWDQRATNTIGSN